MNDTELAESYRQRIAADGPQWSDECRAFVAKVTSTHVVTVIPMIFNDRVAIERKEHWLCGYSAAWCYDKGAAAMLAAVVWDPDTEVRPVGFKKEAADARDPEELPQREEAHG